jgi:predicted DNA-binding transcriptional regulator AlpA
MTRTKISTPAITVDGLATLPTLLTARQVYELLGLDKRSFYRELAAGRIPKPIRVGLNRTRWRSDDLRKWMDSLAAA